jgi:hypothetical protein
MKEENHHQGLLGDKRYKRRAINQLAIGLIIVLWGGLLILKQVGVIEKDVSTRPFAFVPSAYCSSSAAFTDYMHEKNNG